MVVANSVVVEVVGANLAIHPIKQNFQYLGKGLSVGEGIYLERGNRKQSEGALQHFSVI